MPSVWRKAGAAVNRPIRDDSTQARYQIVVSFRMQAVDPKDGDRDLIEAFVRNRLGSRDGLTVHVRAIGAGGEVMEHEGLWPEGSLE